MGRTRKDPRPKYETEAHRKQERDFVGYLEGVFKCKILKVPHRYKVDAIGVRGEAETGVFWFELKQRRKRWNPYMISVRKLWSGVELARATGMPFYLCIRFPKSDFAGKITPKFLRSLGVGVGGRKDRGDSGDVEPCAFIPLERMDRITM